MLFIATFIVIMLAMAALGLSLFLGNGQAPQAGCGNDCRCVDGNKET